MDATDGLIARLASGLEPVRRLQPPPLRALFWLGWVALASAVLVWLLSRHATFIRRAADPALDVELAGTLLTGILAVLAAFELSVPGRSPRWMLLPLPSFLLWLGSSSYSCWHHWVRFGPEGWQIGESAECFAWIVGLGIPLGASLFQSLRQAMPLAPGPVAAMAGLGVAAIAAFVLQFFHPFDVTVIDLGLHMAAIGVVVVFARAAAEPALRAPEA
jgi:hypothetical protein